MKGRAAHLQPFAPTCARIAGCIYLLAAFPHQVPLLPGCHRSVAQHLGWRLAPPRAGLAHPPAVQPTLQ
eukprot:gene4810-4970_t